jgi:hypothetical protein
MDDSDSMEAAALAKQSESEAAATRATDAAVRHAYGLFYTMMNVGLIFVGPVVDWLRFAVAHPYRWAAILSMNCGLGMFVLACQIDPIDRSNTTGTKDIVVVRPAAPAPAAAGEPELAEKHQRKRGFCILVALLVGVRALFRHLDATWPKFFIRSFGPHAPFGTVYALEPFLIITLVPVLSGDSTVAIDWCCAPLTRAVRSVQSLESLTAITFGAYVGTLAPFVLVVSSAEAASIAFVTIMATGEALWAPRFYTYTHEVAPPEDSGKYFAFSTVPMFLPKLLAGMMSGQLLAAYCPGPADTRGGIEYYRDFDAGTGCSEGWRVWLGESRNDLAHL